MMLALLLAAAQVGDADRTRFDRCADLATGSDPAAAEREASTWRLAGGGMLARQCMGLAYATELRWSAAAAEFEAAARAAETAKDAHASDYWAQAGNAWLAGSEPAKARAALDAALAPATLVGQPRGEAELDRARAAVAAGDTAAARNDIDHALVDSPADPLAWLLSATLARRTNDLPRAQKDIAEALKRAADDPAVQLEAGNIAAKAGDAAGAQTAWRQAVKLRPDSDAGRSAAMALQQFETPSATMS